MTKTHTAKEYLVGAYEPSAKGSKDFNHSWAAIAPDSIVWSDLGHVGPPANMLPHYDSQICYKECIFLRLEKRETNRCGRVRKHIKIVYPLIYNTSINKSVPVCQLTTFS